jgi:hypothetical protein
MESRPTPATPAVMDGAAVLASIRATVIGNRQPYKQIAEALGCTERAVRMLVDRYRIPYIRVINIRHVDPADIHTALLRDQANVPPRRPGRPRKAAA